MPDVTVDKGITLDLLDQQKPQTSATSDMPVVETHPDAVAKPKPDAAASKDAKPEDSATSEPPVETTASDAPRKPAQGVQKRLDELTRQREDEKRARIATEQRLERTLKLLEQAMAGKPAQAEVKGDDGDAEPAEPDVAKYTEQEAYNRDYRQYLRSLSAWSGRQEAKRIQREASEQTQKQRQEEAARKAAETYHARVAKAREKYPDYDDKVYSESVPFTRPMADAISESEFGPDVAYHLASNPEEFSRIAALPPRSQIMELGYLTHQFRQAAKPDAPKPQVSQAPKPIRPIGGGGGSPAPGASVTGGEESMEAYAARRAKELAAERRPGGVRR